MTSSRLRVLVAPDKFKGTLTAREAAAAIAAGVDDAGAAPEIAPMADGGDGTLDALGGVTRYSTVTGPLGAPISAGWRLANGQAVVESALASGLVLAGGAAGNDPVRATSMGTGELIAAALEAGATQVLVGVGGTASTDGGLGALHALDVAGVLDQVPGRVTVLADVRTRFLDAAAVFAPQKGADPSQVEALADRLRDDAADQAARFGARGAEVPHRDGSGAGGGLAGGLYAAGARIADGADAVARQVGLAELIDAADLVITGEGQFDTGSLSGKAPGHVLALARRLGVPALVIAGAVDAGAVDADVASPPGVTVVSLTDYAGTDAALTDASGVLRRATAHALLELPRDRPRHGPADPAR